MNLLEIVREMGFDPIKTGEEYHSPCPGCGGRDRFVIWPDTGRYWCRQCRKSGDSIQFYRDFMGLDFKEAMSRMGESKYSVTNKKIQHPIIAVPWLSRAKEFVENSHSRLMIDEQARTLLQNRGLHIDSVQKYALGWNPIDSFPERESWGLEKKIVEGKLKKLFLPKGIVIPIFKDNKVQRIKIRKSEWKQGDPFGKYHEVPGGGGVMGEFGDHDHEVVMLVEAELDGMLVAQEASELCVVLALGGAQKRLNPEIDAWIRGKRTVLYALDFDESGKKEYAYWKTHYANVHAWPVPRGKSPEEAYCRFGIDLKHWIDEGLQQFRNKH